MKRSASSTELSNRELPPAEKKQESRARVYSEKELEIQSKLESYQDIVELELWNTQNIHKETLPRNLKTLTVYCGNFENFLNVFSYPSSLRLFRIKSSAGASEEVSFQMPRESKQLYTFLHLQRKLISYDPFVNLTIENISEWSVLPDFILLLDKPVNLTISIELFNEKFDGSWVSKIQSIIIKDPKAFNNDSIIQNTFCRKYLKQLHIGEVFDEKSIAFCQRWLHTFRQLELVRLGNLTFRLPDDESKLRTELYVRYMGSKVSKNRMLSLCLNEANYTEGNKLFRKIDEYQLVLTDLSLEIDFMDIFPLPDSVKRLRWICDENCVYDSQYGGFQKFGDGLEAVYFEKSPILSQEPIIWDIETNNAKNQSSFLYYHYNGKNTEDSKKSIPIFRPCHSSYLSDVCKTVCIGNNQYDLKEAKEQGHCNKRFRDDFLELQATWKGGFAFWSRTYRTNLEKLVDFRVYIIEINRGKKIECLKSINLQKRIGIRINLDFEKNCQGILNHPLFFEQEVHDKCRTILQQRNCLEWKQNIKWYTEDEGLQLWQVLCDVLPDNYKSDFREDEIYVISREKEWKKFFQISSSTCKKLIVEYHVEEKTCLELPENIQWLHITTSTFPNIRLRNNSLLHTIEFGSQYSQPTQWRSPIENENHNSRIFIESDGYASLPSCVRQVILCNQHNEKDLLFYHNSQNHTVLKERFSSNMNSSTY